MPYFSTLATGSLVAVRDANADKQRAATSNQAGWNRTAGSQIIRSRGHVRNATDWATSQASQNVTGADASFVSRRIRLNRINQDAARQAEICQSARLCLGDAHAQ